ncbi:MAG: hypothetical protein ABL940_13625 [Bacteroidia bacterium]
MLDPDGNKTKYFRYDKVLKMSDAYKEMKGRHPSIIIVRVTGHPTVQDTNWGYSVTGVGLEHRKRKIGTKAKF